MKYLLFLLPLFSQAFDVAIAIDDLIPAAKYRGSTTANNEAAYSAITWQDTRTKPTWTAIVAAQVGLDEDQAEADAKEAARKGKQPKRSEINSAKSKAANAATLAEAIDAIQEMAVLLDKVLEFQNVKIIEDTE